MCFDEIGTSECPDCLPVRWVGTLDRGLPFKTSSGSPRLMISGVVGNLHIVAVALQYFVLTNQLLL